MPNQTIKYRGQIYKLAAADMPLQVMLLRPGKQFDESTFYVRPTGIEGTSSHMGNNKPRSASGTLAWTSSLVDQQTDWLSWCRTDMPSWIGDKAVIFSVHPQAVIAHIGDQQAYAKFATKYPAEPSKKPTSPYIRSGPAIDFAKMSKDYSAVHVHNEGLWIDALRGWDAESTAWFDPYALKVERIVDVKHECSIPAEQEVEDWERNQATSYKIDASTKPKFLDILGHRYSVISR